MICQGIRSSQPSQHHSAGEAMIDCRWTAVPSLATVPTVGGGWAWATSWSDSLPVPVATVTGQLGGQPSGQPNRSIGACERGAAELIVGSSD